MGYPSEENTWQSAEDLDCPKLLAEFMQRHAQSPEAASPAMRQPGKGPEKSPKKRSGSKGPEARSPAKSQQREGPVVRHAGFPPKATRDGWEKLVNEVTGLRESSDAKRSLLVRIGW